MPLTQRFDEKVDVEFAPVPRTSRKPAMVELAVVLVALKFPNVGVEVATICPEALVARSELIDTDESVVAPVIVKLLVVSVPMLPVVAKRFVDEAVVVKKLVEVAEVDVELIAVKFCMVVEPIWRVSPA